MKYALSLIFFISFRCFAQDFVYPDSPDAFLETYIKAHKNKDEYVLNKLFYPIEKLWLHPEQTRFLTESIKQAKKNNQFFEENLEKARVELVKAEPKSMSIVKGAWKYAFEPEYLIYIYRPEGDYSIYAFGRKDGHYYGDPLVPSTAWDWLNSFLQEIKNLIACMLQS